MPIKILETKNWNKGIQNKLEDQSIDRSALSTELNFITAGDKMEIRRGSLILGDEQTGSGRITGLRKGTKSDGTEIVFRTRARKIEYYNSTTQLWVEIGTDTLESAASGEDISIEPYVSLAGSFVYLGSPNSHLRKIVVANPGDISDQNHTTNFQGKIRIKRSATYLFDRGGTSITDKTQLYRSKLDKDEYTDYTQISAESVGSSGSQTYSGTLAFKAAGSRRTCLQVQITDTVETFNDDKNGVLVGSAGGTGTINYTTGAYSVTFNAVTANPVTATYRWEDSAVSGIMDFAFSATRVAAEGFVLAQNDAGNFQNIFSYNDKEYCMHEDKTFVVTISADDTDLTNLVYRSKVGIPNWRAAVETGDGIYYIDDVDENNPQFRLLTIGVAGTDQVIPLPVSPLLDLSGYRFDTAAGIEWGDYILFACRTSSATANNRVLAYHKIWKSWDVLEFFVSCFEIYNGTLIAGDSISNNVYTLFSGLDDSDISVPASAETKLDNLDIDQLKKVKRLHVQGQIGPDQIVGVYLSVDRGSYVKIGQIRGDADYVDKSQSVNVGSLTLGRGEIGGGSDGVTAYNYWREFPLTLGRFYQIKVKFITDTDGETGESGVGYFSFSTVRFYDIRTFQKKLPSQYRST